MAFLTNLLGVILNALVEVTGSYGLAIIGMALVVMLITFPLNLRQMQFSFKMKLIAPKIEEIKKKYKDPDKVNEETLALWKEHGINPAAGCFPLLIQFPIIIAMFNVLRQPGIFSSAPSFLGLSLVLPDAEQTFWMLIRQNPGYLVVPILAVATTVFQQRQMSQGSEQDAAAMRSMNLFLPVLMGYISISYPTALGLYWVSRNVFTIIQYYLVTRMLERKYSLEEGVQLDAKRRKAR
ncbi:MAG: YidC/Oxa1 family membrane protein insertase [Firmicutes bacterium]|nr:YidC/Oxa1 family membrane protein insertase [Bacillota bacterium]